MRTKIALFPGRFQPVNIAHAATVETILAEWQNVTIAVATSSTDLDYDERWRPYVEASRNRFAQKQAMFTPDEIKQMWDAWIEDRGLGARVLCVLAPRIYLKDFSRRFPADLYDIVYPSSHLDDSEGDKHKYESFGQLLNREISFVDPPFRLHNTQIRNLIALRQRTWRDVLPPAAYQVFMSLDGPERACI